ncbi:MAG: NAD(P)/FAD-dependent oxidoreductase [Acidobacteriota bacterium]
MEQSRFAILGGGMAAGYAAKQLVELGLKPGELAILSADTFAPYERPPLSKGFLAGRDTEDGIRINPESFYREHGIEVKLSCEVAAIDAGRKRLTLARGGEFGFEKLIAAPGAAARRLDIPGAQLDNVRHLRSLDDSAALRQRAENAKRAVVIGGGFIGMEVGAVLAQKGIEVTLALRDDRIGKAIFTPEMSRFFETYYAAKGVRIVKGMALKELRGAGAVSSAVLDGGQEIPCDLVVAGIGAAPVTDMLAASGFEINNGVVVNEYLETSLPGIYAAGDAANYYDVLFNKRRRVEHWDNAVSQGEHCARQLMGERAPFRHVPYFFSDVFDLSYEYWGDAAGADQVVHKGDVTTNSFSVWWLRGGRVVAAFVMNRPDAEREAAPKWIESGEDYSRQVSGL